MVASPSTFTSVDRMANVLLGWEMGAGLGHAGRLKPLAVELARRGHEPAMALRDLVHPRRLLADLDCPKLQTPAWLHRMVGAPQIPASLAEILMGYAYMDVNSLEGLVLGWRDLMRVTRADLVVTDYAPTATIAARMLDIRVVAVGPGFWIPPAEGPLPDIRDWAPAPAKRLQESEATILRTANEVLARHRGRPFTRGSELFRGDRALLCAWPEFDHYQRKHLPEGERWYGPNYLPGSGVEPDFPPGEGPKAFAYVKSGFSDHPAVLQALAAAGCRTLCYLPDVATGKKPPVPHPSIRYATGPVNLAKAFDGAALCVCHAGGATMVQALLAGVPCLLLPTQNEQFLLARCVERTGACVNAGARPAPVDYRAIIAELSADGRAREAARAFALRHRDFSHEQQTRDLVDAIEQEAGVRSQESVDR